MSAKTVVLIDPLGNECSYERKVLRNWRNFLKTMAHNSQRAKWQIKTMQHNRQRDGSSCGVLVLKVEDFK
ncbi:hypothetical protein SRHO_G00179140 [Serrasalmus rhombeus]